MTPSLLGWLHYSTFGPGCQHFCLRQIAQKICNRIVTAKTTAPADLQPVARRSRIIIQFACIKMHKKKLRSEDLDPLSVREINPQEASRGHVDFLTDVLALDDEAVDRRAQLGGLGLGVMPSLPEGNGINEFPRGDLINELLHDFYLLFSWFLRLLQQMFPGLSRLFLRLAQTFSLSQAIRALDSERQRILQAPPFLADSRSTRQNL